MCAALTGHRLRAGWFAAALVVLPWLMSAPRVEASSPPVANRPVATPARLVRPPEARVLHALFVGGSLTYGYYASSTATTFTADVARTLALSGRAVSVTTVARPDARATAALTWSYPQRSDVTVVQLVTNDFAAPTPLSPFRSAYSSLLSRLRQLSPATHLVCLSAWMEPWRLNHIHLHSADYNRAAASACAAARGDFVDISQVFDLVYARGPAGRLTPFGRSDLLHPNDVGHRLIARVITEVLLPHARPPSVSHAFITKVPVTHKSLAHTGTAPRMAAFRDGAAAVALPSVRRRGDLESTLATPLLLVSLALFAGALARRRYVLARR